MKSSNAKEIEHPEYKRYTIPFIVPHESPVVERFYAESSGLAMNNTSTYKCTGFNQTPLLN